MTFTMPHFIAIIPEIFVLSMACVVLLIDLIVGKIYRNIAYLLTQLTLVGAAVLTLALFKSAPTLTFENTFMLDLVANILKLFIYIASFFTFLYSRHYIEERDIPVGEYYVLGLFSILGMMIVVSAYSLLTLFLGLELLSLPLYAMVALRRDSSLCAEGAMKYFVMGALASAMLLYGMSMVYGATKSLDILTVATIATNTPVSQSLFLIFGLVFLIAGITFKIGAAPFHMWVPDVYHGAPSSVTLFIGSASKVASLGIVIRLLVDALPHFYSQWQEMLMVVAILSMAIGNIVAIVQTNIKRMLAYSAIAHMGYMTLGLIAATPEGYAAALFYMISYTLMSLGAFGMIVLVSRTGFEAEHVNDLRGLNVRNPWLAFMMLLVMFSMAGIPPTVGFFAKLGVLEAIIHVNLVWLAVLALIFAIIGAYYYLSVVKVMYFEPPERALPVRTSLDMQIAISLNGLAVLGLGLFPSALIGLCRAAFMVS